MIESVFYFTVMAFLGLLGFGLWQKSAAFLALAGVFGILLGVTLTGEGISYPTGFDLDCVDCNNNLSVATTYTTLHTYDSAHVNMWHYFLLYGSFIWIIAAFLLAVKRRQGDFIGA